MLVLVLEAMELYPLCDCPPVLLATGVDDALLLEGEQSGSDELAVPVDVPVVHPGEGVLELARGAIHRAVAEEGPLRPEAQGAVECLVQRPRELWVAVDGEQLWESDEAVVPCRVGRRCPRDLDGLNGRGRVVEQALVLRDGKQGIRRGHWCALGVVSRCVCVRRLAAMPPARAAV